MVRLSAAASLLALMLFCLPWLEFSCRAKSERGSMTTIVSQSGLQAAYGGVSQRVITVDGDGNTTVVDSSTSRRSTSTKGKSPRTRKGLSSLQQQDNELAMALPLWLYLGLLVAAVATGATFRDGKNRFRYASACAGGALIVLIVQCVMGFPFNEKLASQEKEMKSQLRDLEKMGGGSGKAGPGEDFGPEIDQGFTFWFYLAMLTTIASPGLLAAEWGIQWTNRGTKRAARAPPEAE